MDMSELHSLTNDYRRVKLVSLRNWKHAAEIEPRDQGGPYVVTQAGYDPEDPKMDYDEFLIGRSGSWFTASLFFKLPKQVRRDEFVFGTASEVIQLLESLPSHPRIVSSATDKDLDNSVNSEPDDLIRTFSDAAGG